MAFRNACDVVCDGPRNSFRIPDKLGSKVLGRAHSSPRLVDKASHLLVVVFDIIEAFVIVFSGLDSRGKHICLGE